MRSVLCAWHGKFGKTDRMDRSTAAEVSGLSRAGCVRFPLMVAGGALAVGVVLRIRDPHVSGAYGLCPIHAVTGLWCPSCGGLRAIHDLTRFDFAGASASNLLIVPLVAVAALTWVVWVGRSLAPQPRVTRRAASVGARWWGAGTLAVVVVVFTVLRNTPWGSWLAPA